MGNKPKVREVEFGNPLGDIDDEERPGASELVSASANGSFESEVGASGGAEVFDKEAPGGAGETFESEVDDGSAGGLNFDDDMFQDLVFAFDSCDLDGRGFLVASELMAVVRVLAGAERAENLDLETTQALIRTEWEELERRGGSTSSADGLIKGSVKRTAAGAGATLKRGVKRVTRNSARNGEAPTISKLDLDYAMFVDLITSGRAGAFIGEDHDDWVDHAHKLRLLSYAWNTADADGDGKLTKEEMSDVGATLLGRMTPHEFEAFWDLLTPDGDSKSLTYLDFLNGMSRAELHPVFAAKLEFLKPNQLMTVLMDVPVMAKEERMMLGSLSFAERLGVNVLKRKAQRTAEKEATDGLDSSGSSARDEAMHARLAQGTVHLLADEQRQKVRKYHRHLILWGCLFGFLSSMCTALTENVATYYLNTNGIENPDTGEPSPAEDIKLFATIVFGTLMVCSIIEIAMLYLYALRHVMYTAYASGLRLTPLNRDRTHIAQFLVQAALEMAHHNNVVHGVDPLKDSRDRGKCLIIFFLVLYKAKIALTSFVLKIALKRLLSRDVAKYAVPYMAVPATMLWNALIAHGVMKQARLRSVGISAAVELFDAILNESSDVASSVRSGEENSSSPKIPTEKLSPLFKLQLLRSIGVVITKRKGLYPTQEVLLKHAVHALHMSAQVDNTESYVDSEHDFLSNMGELTLHEQGQCLQVFVLTVLLDGHFSRGEKMLYHKLCDAVDEQFEPHVTYIQHCAQRLRNTQPVTDVDIRHCVYLETGDGAHELTSGYYVQECLHKLFSVCTC